jgi:IS5 family transposase
VPAVDLAIPAFGYKNHVSIDRGFGLIRNWTTTHAAAHDGARLEDVLDRTNTASDVWANNGSRAVSRNYYLMNGLAAPIHRERCFSEIFIRRDFGRGSSFGYFTA